MLSRTIEKLLNCSRYNFTPLHFVKITRTDIHIKNKNYEKKYN